MYLELFKKVYYTHASRWKINSKSWKDVPWWHHFNAKESYIWYFLWIPLGWSKYHVLAVMSGYLTSHSFFFACGSNKAFLSIQGFYRGILGTALGSAINCRSYYRRNVSVLALLMTVNCMQGHEYERIPKFVDQENANTAVLVSWPSQQFQCVSGGAVWRIQK